MTTFASIFDRTGPTEMARRIGFDDPNTVYAWKRTESIPAAYWRRLADADVATLEELADAAVNRRSRVEGQAA